jgi:phosphomannomutase
MTRHLPAIMVTGSHIPDDRNGLKFYRDDGEITKEGEGAILAALKAEAGGVMPAAGASATPEPGAVSRYPSRYLDAFDPNALSGFRVAVYQQSTVARDLLVEILSALGAAVVPIGRSGRFIPIDT